METEKINVYFAHTLPFKQQNEKVVSNFDELNWKFIKKFAICLYNYLVAKGFDVKKDFNSYLTLSDRKLIFGLDFEINVENKYDVIKEIENFLLIILNNNNSDYFIKTDDEGNEAITDFLKSYSGKDIKSPLIIQLLKTTFKVHGKFTVLHKSLADLESHFEIVGRISHLGFDARDLAIISENGQKISIIKYDVAKYFDQLCNNFEGQNFIKFIIDQQVTAKEKIIYVLNSIEN